MKPIQPTHHFHSPQVQAEILVSALPYIQQYTHRTVVIKYGGSAMKDEALKAAVMQDLVLLHLAGIHVVLVHGGGPEINALLQRLAIESRFKDGLRVTDAQTMEVVQMVLCGKVNKSLVAQIAQAGGNAVGLCGQDGHLLCVKAHPDAELGYVGEVASVSPALIQQALSGGFIPVIATVGCDANGQAYNVNADTAAAQIAIALGAENLILMTDVRGVMTDPHDASTLLPTLTPAQAASLRQQGVLRGGMIPKVDCCLEAIAHGVGRATVIDGRIPHSLLIEMLSDEGIGTQFHL